MNQPVQITLYNKSHDELTVVMGGKRYKYFNVSPAIHNQIRACIQHSNNAHLFKLLKSCSHPERVERSKPQWIQPPKLYDDDVPSKKQQYLLMLKEVT